MFKLKLDEEDVVVVRRKAFCVGANAVADVVRVNNANGLSFIVSKLVRIYYVNELRLLYLIVLLYSSF